jgi:hypothetical protein
LAWLSLGTFAPAAAQPSLRLLFQGKWPAWTRGAAHDVKVVGNYAYVADGGAGLQVIDVRNPANPVRVGGYETSVDAWGVAVVADRIYMADGENGLLVLPSLPNVQFTVRVEANPRSFLYPRDHHRPAGAHLMDTAVDDQRARNAV